MNFKIMLKKGLTYSKMETLPWLNPNDSGYNHGKPSLPWLNVNENDNSKSARRY